MTCLYFNACFFINITDDIECKFQIEDARAAMLLYQRNRKQWERSIKDFTRLKNKQKKRKLKNKLKGGSADVHNVVVAS